MCQDQGHDDKDSPTESSWPIRLSFEIRNLMCSDCPKL